ncbi:CHAT domain-containing protein [Pseudanabaena sp. ABRG5-3]|uniref:CHAT domain-containing protein n=1 Tax=Pseudanabaena sp. ABRG5-3 TaxID=685565 RepID=UPI000DC7148E|nr:TPR repeat-containing protein [Pseudanabaena sp. ABRG5-3]
MNTQRQEAYINLILTLLDCSSGEEVKVLSANQRLVDAGLVQTMLRVANEQITLGKLDAANFLMNLAGQLLGAYSNTPLHTSSISTSSSVSQSESQRRFLLRLLQATDKSKGNPQVVYPLLQGDLDLLDDNFAQVLKNWATDTLSTVKLDTARATAVAILSFSNLIGQFPLGKRMINLEIAIAGYEAIILFFTNGAFPFELALTQMNLGNVYIDRIRGEKAENIERTIQCYQQALLVFTREVFPTNWAETQTNLGCAYSNRIVGKKADNFEQAIRCHQQALSVLTREAFPIGWARTQNNLGLAYRERIRGDKAENLEEAINSHQQTLSVLTREAFPADWAGIQMNLASAYRERIKGEKAENLERSIQAYQEVLLVLTREAFPMDWAGGQMNLVGAYSNRIRGEKAENIERAIQACQQALSVFTREASPTNWAMTQTNLGSAYSGRIRGEKVENIELAIQCYQQALSVFTREAFPFNWAEIQDNLGIAYLQRRRGEKAENIELAIQACQQALSVFTRESFPTDWAMTQINLGSAYSGRIRGEKAENIELAIQVHQLALSVFTREAFPTDWARNQNNLGLAYLQRIGGGKAKNLERAIQAYQQALSVRTRDAFPQNNVQTLFNLGIAYQTSNQLQLAYDTFESGIETLELLRDDIHSGDDIKQKLAEEWTGLYHRIVAVCLGMSRETEAIEYVERSKTRNLVELILTRDRHTIFSAEVVTQLDILRDEIASGQYELQNATAEDPTALAQHLQQLRQQRNKLQDRYLPIGSGFQFEQFRSTLSDRTAIVEFYITTDKLLVFIITKQTQQPIVLSPDLIDLNKLANWANSYLKAYSNKKAHWQRRLTTRLHLLAKILHIDEIIEQIPTECDKLILIPHRYLHLLPLHALPLAGDSLFDRFPEGVSYAPSCQLLQLAQNRQRPEFTRLFAVQNPTGDLSYTDIEVETIQSYFSTTNLLKQKIATKEAVEDTSLNTVHCAHFSCHGYFNGTEPRKSALILANAQLNSAPTQPDTENYLSLGNGGVLDLNKCLTLDSIFTLNLEQCRLVTLSACETGLIDFHNTSDEYIGLPSGFLYAGASSVVSSLWTVNDFSTAFLMIWFYQNLQKGLAVGLALNQAQIWLKDLTKGALETWIEENQLQLKPAVRMNLRRRLYKLEEDAKPFESPFYWAAFSALGQ